MDDDWELLELLCMIHAVSGREDRMTRFVHDRIVDLVDEVHIDRLGNVVGIIKGTRQPEYKLMLQAHMDELGLIVRSITNEGFLLFERVGGIPEKSILSQRVDVLTEKGEMIGGYVGTKSHHITDPQEKYVVPTVHKLYVDVGLSSRAQVEKAGIQVGDPITYHPNFNRFGDGLICSKALDDRIGVYVLMKIMENLQKHRPASTIIFSFTVLEEFSIRGSLPTVNRTRPDAIISIDITVSPDTPSDEKDLNAVKLGQGPAMKLMDFHGRGTLGGIFSSPPFRHYIESIADRLKIPLQRDVIIGVITDPAFQIYLGEEGYTVAGISIPQRYTHASSQTVHENDLRRTIELLSVIATEFDNSVDLRRGMI